MPLAFLLPQECFGYSTSFVVPKKLLFINDKVKMHCQVNLIISILIFTVGKYVTTVAPKFSDLLTAMYIRL